MSLSMEICLRHLKDISCLLGNAYNFDAHPWPQNTILIAGDSMINGINEKRISTNYKSVKVRCFSGATTDGMYFNLIQLLR